MSLRALPPASRQTTLRRLQLRCPPLPQTLMEAMHLMNEPDRMEVRPVTDLVQRDPAVVAQLLHMVNSAYYGLRRTVECAERAVVMLGPVGVVGIVVGMNMLKLRGLMEGPAARCSHRLIRHSIAVAYLTRHLLESSPDGHRAPRRGGIGFTAGLLHDFGKLILLHSFPEEAVGLYEKRTLADHLEAQNRRQFEQLLFGCDHTEAGEYAARKLGLSDTLTYVIRLHHRPDATTNDAATDGLVRAVACANLAASALGYAGTQRIAWEACGEDPAWALFAPGREDVVLDDLCAQQEPLDAFVTAMSAAGEEVPKLGR